MSWWLIFVLSVLAVHRLTHLVIDDKITEPIRNWFFDRWNPAETWTYLFTCPWCVSIWAGIATVIGIHLFWIPIPWFCAVLLVLAISSVVGLIFKVEDRM